VIETPVPADRPRLLRPWNTYFAERFSPLQHGLLIAAFTFGVLAYTAALASPSREPAWPGFAVASATVFLVILRLRILGACRTWD
jgi:4-hydroxybenzoate polyprenyltransferase